MRDTERNELFARARRAASPTEDDRRRVRAALSRKLGVGTVAVVAATASKAAAGAASTGGAVAVGMSAATIVKAAVAVVAVSAVLGTVIPARRSAPPAADEAPTHAIAADVPSPAVSAPPRRQVAPTSSPVAAASVPPPATETAPASPGADPARPVERTSPASTNAGAALPVTAGTPHDPVASPVKPAVPATADPTEGDTGPETALLADMQAALRDADSKRVLSLVAEHERLFPRSSFAPEREGARTLALCMGADHFNAARIGQAFLDAHPLSPLAGRVRGTCQLDSAAR